MVHGRVSRLLVHDVRFPTSLGGHGSDAMHTDPDYSVAYVVLETDAEDGLRGCGLTFTLGKGTEVVVCAVNALAHHVLHRDLKDIVGNFRGFYRQLTSDGQLRWIGPEKGAVHLATAAILNAVWDLWAKQEGKPLWKLLVDMDPRTLLSCIDFRYITDALTEEDALEILQKGQVGKKEREQILTHGYPAYTTSCAWLGYPDDLLKQLCAAALKDGWTRFKVKVGADLQDDMRRCRLIRDLIGPDRTLMMDANQRWDVPEAVAWMSKLAEFKPLWIEEPTSPDDILGHAAIAKALAPLGIGVATGEQCHNRVVFKQLLQANALQFLQIDSCRLGSVNENLSVILMAKKFGTRHQEDLTLLESDPCLWGNHRTLSCDGPHGSHCCQMSSTQGRGCVNTWITYMSTSSILCTSSRPPTCLHRLLNGNEGGFCKETPVSRWRSLEEAPCCSRKLALSYTTSTP
ncbi:mitochondrial enolase superfamily member 1 isoform X2 [Cavia porcellus]|uniref:mitochondrial enolase superfamily member 1 isoform X2 n=1 Tax=Cavia porcellus TaxID=10141 RepID=UPI002FE1F4AE